MTGGRQLVIAEGQEIAVSENYVGNGVVTAGVDLDPALKDHWQAEAPHRHAVALGAISKAADFAEGDTSALFASFDNLPGMIQVAILDQLSNGSVSKRHVKLNGDEGAFLSDTACGRILRDRWGSGSRAEFKVAMALKRMDHILGNLNAEDGDAAVKWLKQQPADLEAALWVALAE